MTTKDGLIAAQQRLTKEVIDHHILREKISEVHSHLSLPIPGTVVLLVGLPGTGATRIARAVRERCRSDVRPFSPFTAIEIAARAPTSSRFRWKAFFETGLGVLEEPILGQRRRATEAPDRKTEFVGFATFRGEEEVRSDFENALRRRTTKVLSVTHAHNMLRRLPPEEMHHPLLVFQELAGTRWHLPSVVMLSGKYDLQKMIRNDSKADLSTVVIDVPPYPVASPSEADARNWLEAVGGFAALLKDVVPDGMLEERAKDLAQGTLGNVGWVKRALSDSLKDVQEGGKPRELRWKDIERRLPTERARKRMAEELLLGVEWFAGRPEEDGQAPDENQGGSKGGRPRRGRVGERNASRDRVGMS